MVDVQTTKTESAKANPSSVDLDDPSLFINRELSLLEFNWRVLEEAQNPDHPLLERAKFLAIYHSNMDEFFMVRVAGLKQQVIAGVTKMTPDGLTPARQLKAIRKIVKANVKIRQDCFREIREKLKETGIYLHYYEELSKSQQLEANEYFKERILPVLTPLAFDPGHPFPHISSLSLNLAVLVHNPKDGSEHFARVKVPDKLPRLIPVKRRSGESKKVHHFVWLEDLIAHNLSHLFLGHEIVESHQFRITRNADLEIEANEAGDLLETIEANLRRRRFGFVVRLTVTPSITKQVRRLLVENLQVSPEGIYESEGPLGLSSLMSLIKVDRPDLKFPPFQPIVPARIRDLRKRAEIFDIIRENDILLHHPYDSFEPVVDFLKAAARDPNVLAIKQTLYRVGANAPVVDVLLEARENGKQVAALVELKARFDEESNIGWARALEQVGVHVVYGFRGIKTHSKICLVVRREGDQIRRYIHLSTGNYNATTAKVYTDLGLFTCHPDFGEDATDLFNVLTGYSYKTDYKKFLVAPLVLRNRFEALIEREIETAKAGKPAKLIFKMNALIDPPFTRQLYRASQAGVQIKLIVRGICGLRPGISGISENIKVISIVGRFLEHTRIYYFYNQGQPEIYLGSADLMPRNLDRRIETVFPIENLDIQQRIIDILEIYGADNLNARLLQSDGQYIRIKPGKEESPLNSQAELLAKAKNS